MNNSLKEILKSKLKTRQFVNKFFPITEFIPSGSGLICCPFHDDSRPSAKMFFDEDYPKLYCYACNKQYASSDYVEQILQRNVVDWLKEKASLNPEGMEVFSDSFVYVEHKSKEFPVKELIEEKMPEFNQRSLGELLRTLYEDKERHEWD